LAWLDLCEKFNKRYADQPGTFAPRSQSGCDLIENDNPRHDRRTRKMPGEAGMIGWNYARGFEGHFLVFHSERSRGFNAANIVGEARLSIPRRHRKGHFTGSSASLKLKHNVNLPVISAYRVAFVIPNRRDSEGSRDPKAHTKVSLRNPRPWAGSLACARDDAEIGVPVLRDSSASLGDSAGLRQPTGLPAPKLLIKPLRFREKACCFPEHRRCLLRLLVFAPANYL
jgi:hypothetical protein